MNSLARTKPTHVTQKKHSAATQHNTTQQQKIQKKAKKKQNDTTPIAITTGTNWRRLRVEEKGHPRTKKRCNKGRRRSRGDKPKFSGLMRFTKDRILRMSSDMAAVTEQNGKSPFKKERKPQKEGGMMHQHKKKTHGVPNLFQQNSSS